MKIRDFFPKWGGNTPEPTQDKAITKFAEKGLLGLGVSDIYAPNQRLVDTKTVSSKLLEAFNGWVYANVSTIARSVSRIELSLYTTKVIGGQVELTELDDHPLLDILERFNDMTSQTDGFYLTQSHLELAGDTFWLLDGKGLQIKNIYLLEPDKITVNPVVENNIIQIQSYDYQQTIDGKTIKVNYQPEDVIHFKVPNPNNPVRGKSVVEAAATVIDTEVFAEEYNKGVFTRGAIQKFILTTDKNISDEQMKRLEAQLQKNYAGFNNSHKMLVLGNGLNPSNISQSNRDMEFSTQLDWARDKITNMFGNNKAVLGITDDVNRANAEATIDNWLKENIKPKMQRIVDTLNEFLVPQFGTNLILGFEDPAPENRGDAVDEVATLYANAQTPVMSLNEARERIDLEELPGDMNNYPAGSEENPKMAPPAIQDNPKDPPMPKSIRNVNYKAVFRRSGVYKEIANYKQKVAFKAEAKGLARKIITKNRVKEVEIVKPDPVQRGSDHFSQPELLAYWKKIDYISAKREKAFAAQVVRFLEQVEVKVLAAVQAIETKGLKKAAQADLFSMDGEVSAGINLFKPLVTELANVAGQEAYKLIKYLKNYTPSPTAQGQIDKHTEFFVKSMLTTDKDKLAKTIADGITNGQSVDQIGAAIKDQFGEIKKNQSKMIARTETIRASNMAAVDAFQQSGVVDGKEWLTAGDDHVDEDCLAYDGMTVGIDDEFAEGDPPLHPNCRCVVIPVLGDATEKKLKAELTKLKKANTRLNNKLSEKEAVIKELAEINE